MTLLTEPVRESLLRRAIQCTQTMCPNEPDLLNIIEYCVVNSVQVAEYMGAAACCKCDNTWDTLTPLYLIVMWINNRHLLVLGIHFQTYNLFMSAKPPFEKEQGVEVAVQGCHFRSHHPSVDSFGSLLTSRARLFNRGWNAFVVYS